MTYVIHAMSWECKSNLPNNFSCFEIKLLILSVPHRSQLLYPAREYITQIARFDPSKGIPDVIESYRKLYARIIKDTPEKLPPQLLL